jgi:hypothetical protein
LSRFVIEEDPGKTQIAYSEDRVTKRTKVKELLLKHIGTYTVYNGFAMTRLLNRLTNILEDKKAEI